MLRICSLLLARWGRIPQSSGWLLSSFQGNSPDCRSNLMRCKSEDRRGEVWGLQVLSRTPVFTSYSFFNPFPSFALLFSGCTYRDLQLLLSEPDSPTTPRQQHSGPGLRRTSGWPEAGRAGRRRCCRGTQQRGSAAPWWGAPRPPSSWAFTHPCSCHSAHTLLLFEERGTCLVRGTERHLHGQKEHGGGRTSEVLLAPVLGGLLCPQRLLEAGGGVASSPLVNIACTPG